MQNLEARQTRPPQGRIGTWLAAKRGEKDGEGALDVHLACPVGPCAAIALDQASRALPAALARAVLRGKQVREKQQGRGNRGLVMRSVADHAASAGREVG